MLGHKARKFKQHQSLLLDDLVPDDNFYHQVERSLDLSFVRDLADEFCLSMGLLLLIPWCSSRCNSSLSSKGFVRNGT